MGEKTVNSDGEQETIKLQRVGELRLSLKVEEWLRNGMATVMEKWKHLAALGRRQPWKREVEPHSSV